MCLFLCVCAHCVRVSGIRCKILDQRLWTEADLSAFCHCFRPDGEMCKTAGEACQTESSKGKGVAGKSKRQAAVFHLKRMDTVERGETEMWKYQTRQSERCKARKKKEVSQQAYAGK